eukprot:6490618-Amphidinium_carterae.2
MTTHEEESDQQHAEDVARSFNIFDPENQPEFIANGTQASASEAAPPINVAAPQEPSAAERELHNLTHIPFRSWCEICVRSKARGTYHKGSLKSKSIIQMEYTFLKHSGEPSQRTRLITVLTMVGTVTGMSNAVIIEHKGVTPYALGEVKKFILENGFINSMIQVDGEPTIKTISEAVIASLNGEVKSRLSPSYSHQSPGACEGWHTKLFSHLRLLRLQMSEQFGIPISEITKDHLIVPWMVKHVGFTHNRFQLGQDGQTPYSRTWGQKYKSAIIAFGETVLYQHHHPQNQKTPVRLEPQWSYGIWIGRDTSNGSHLTLKGIWIGRDTSNGSHSHSPVRDS